MPRAATAPVLDADLGDRAFLRVNSRLEPWQLGSGELASSLNGRMDRGSWQTRKAISSLSGSLQVDGDPLRIPFFIVDTPGGLTVLTAERVGTIVELTFATAFFPPQSTGYIGVESLTGSVSPNGVQFVSISFDGASLTFEIPGAVGSETYGGTGKVRSVLDDSAAAQIYGSCLFSDPSSGSAESVLIAATGEAYLVALADGTVTSVAYPTGLLLDGPVDLVQMFDRVRLRRDGFQAWDWFAGDTEFAVIAAGDYTQPQVFEATGGNVDVVSGLCTVTITGNTTIAAGDKVRLVSTDDDHFLDFTGREFLATAASSTSVSFYIPVADLSTIGTNVLSIGKTISVGAGFIHEPAAPWGVYHQRRSIVPYRYTQTGDTETPVYTFRNVEDELVISDILDPDTYDVIENQFRVTAGTSNSLVAVQPFAEDFLIVFMRKSIHLIGGISGSLADTSNNELTREIGCLARKSIVQHGAEVLFLSDNGVYAIGFADQYNLRGVDTALSEAIQPVIDRINPDLAAGAVGVYFDNRYRLAVPLDSAPGAGDATGNNAILVFKFTTGQGWESVDSVNDSRWNILNFHIGRAGERNDLYAVNSFGGVHKMDALDADSDRLALTPGEVAESVPVVSGMTTRQYDAGTTDRKRYSEVQVLTEAASQAVDADFTLLTEDPDAETELRSLTAALGAQLGPLEGASVRIRTGGQRGHGASLVITPTEGRPKVKSVSILAQTSNRGTTQQR